MLNTNQACDDKRVKLNATVTLEIYMAQLHVHTYEYILQLVLNSFKHAKKFKPKQTKIIYSFMHFKKNNNQTKHIFDFDMVIITITSVVVVVIIIIIITVHKSCKQTFAL